LQASLPVPSTDTGGCATPTKGIAECCARPQAEALIGIAPVELGAPLGNDSVRIREIERGEREVQWAPLPREDIDVLDPARKRREQHPFRVPSSNITKHAQTGIERKVNEEVPAHEEISADRHRACDQVEDGESAALTPEPAAILLDDLRENVEAPVIQVSQVCRTHPVKVATGSIDKGLHPKFVKEVRQRVS
jgi:hypothetical protein